MNCFELCARFGWHQCLCRCEVPLFEWVVFLAFVVLKKLVPFAGFFPNLEIYEDLAEKVHI